ncbi:F107 [Hirschfeldia incana]|nr:F107 [Hirschfeldia incana]KAJ0257017.1 F107 [Hirschfeldia incana]
MDDHGGGASDLSLEELMDEYSSRPPQIAEWLWCIEYVAKFVKDIRCILDLMNMGYQYSDDYGRRINEVLSLRILEFMFDPSKNDSSGVGVASASEERVEFDLSLSSADVLRAILREIPVSELRAGMPALSKFNVLPFIAHKNMCLPQCALEKLRDLSLLENATSAAPEMEAHGYMDRPVCSGDRPVHMDTCEEEPIDDEQQVHTGLDKATLVHNEDVPMHINDKDEVIMIDEDTENDQDTDGERIRNGCTTGKTTFPTSSRRWPEDAGVKCTKDGTWLVSVSDDDDESDMVKGPALAKKNTNTDLPLSSCTRPVNVCWKCGKEGTLLTCSRSECASKVHKECLNSAVNFDEDGNFHCPVCWYDRVVADYVESQKLVSSAKRKLMNFIHLLSSRSKRLRSTKAI